MNILILGSGIVGANLAKKLSEQGKNVFLLDDDANELKNLSERFDIKTIFDDPLNPSFYKNFDTKIDYFIAVTRSDEKNIITSKFAKEFLNVDNSIARVRNQNLILDENKSLLIVPDVLPNVFLPKNEVLVLGLLNNLISPTISKDVEGIVVPIPIFSNSFTHFTRVSIRSQNISYFYILTNFKV